MADFTDTTGNDELTGTADADIFKVINGGDDTVSALAGDDIIYFGQYSSGFTAADTVDGGIGSDTLILQGHYGETPVTFGTGTTSNIAGIEIIVLLSGSVTTYGDTTNNFYDYDLTMLEGNVALGQVLTIDASTLRVGEDLTFDGSAQTNTGSFFVMLGMGFNTITTGAGEDTIQVGGGFNILNGGGGSDTVSYASAWTGVVVSLSVTGSQNTGFTNDTLTSFENLIGSAHDDFLTGNDGNNVLEGLAGNDSLTGGAGMDTASYENAAAAVSVSLSLSGAQNTGGAGTDTLTGFENLTGSAHDDFLTGNDGVNVFYGLAGNDTLNGGRGNDVMEGGTGNDTYYAQDAGDVIVERPGEGEGNDDRVLAKVSYTLAAGVAVEFLGTLKESGTEALNLTGNEFGQKIVGNNGANILTGGGGDDDLLGHGGNDTLIGGTGNDTYRVDSMGDVIVENVGEGQDIVRASVSYTLAEGVEVETLTTKKATATSPINLTGNSFNNQIVGNNGKNVLTGGGGNDRLRGEGNTDTLNGGAGSDQLTGGAGNDKFVFTAVSETTVAAPDRILDFASGDLIDLAGIDANTGIANDQGFTFVGSNAFSNTAGELRSYQAPNGTWIVEGDVNGDGIADFAIQVTSGAPLVQTDFVL